MAGEQRLLCVGGHGGLLIDAWPAGGVSGVCALWVRSEVRDLGDSGDRGISEYPLLRKPVTLIVNYFIALLI